MTVSSVVHGQQAETQLSWKGTYRMKEIGPEFEYHLLRNSLSIPFSIIASLIACTPNYFESNQRGFQQEEAICRLW